MSSARQRPYLPTSASAAEASGVPFAAGFFLRVLPNAARLRRAVSAGQLGKLTAIRARYTHAGGLEGWFARDQGGAARPLSTHGPFNPAPANSEPPTTSHVVTATSKFAPPGRSTPAAVGTLRRSQPWGVSHQSADTCGHEVPAQTRSKNDQQRPRPGRDRDCHCNQDRGKRLHGRGIPG